MPMGLCAILLVDSMSTDHVDAKKMAIYVAFIVPVFIFSLIPGIVSVNNAQPGGPVIIISENFLAIFFLYSVVMNLFYLLYNTKIHVYAPRTLKKYTWIYFGSTILYSIVTPVLIAIFSDQIASNLYLIPSICYMIGAAGGAITVYILAIQPKLAYILPFKVVRLTVFETTAGIMLYNYTWRRTEDLIEDELFSAMLQGISLFVDEAIKKGTLEELIVTKGHIILKRSSTYPVAFALVATKTSSSLHAALDNFATKFTAKYGAFINETHDISPFQDAGTLVEACFPFLPEYS
jgi:hypothetical protein